jgi:predicted SAM-dependent methyltransferase
MIIQEKIRLEKTKELIGEGKILEVGIRTNRLTDGMTLDCVEEYNPDILCNLNYERIPVEDNTFDVIVAAEILEHLISPYQVVREFYRILKDNGSLVLSVPNTCSLINRINMLRGKLPSGCAKPIDINSAERHIVDFNKEIIIEIIEEAGFNIEIITSNGVITNGKLITKYIPASMGETLIIKATKESE